MAGRSKDKTKRWKRKELKSLRRPGGQKSSFKAYGGRTLDDRKKSTSYTFFLLFPVIKLYEVLDSIY